MKYQDRIDKVQEVLKIAKDRDNNIFTIAFLLANFNDLEFLKFYKEYINKNSHENRGQN